MRIWSIRQYCRCLLTLSLALPSAPIEALPVRFSEALELVQQHPTLQASRAQRSAAQAEHAAARALAFPRIGVAATYGHFSDAIEVDLDPLNQLIHSIDPLLPSIPNPVLQPEAFGFAMATVAWPVFTGGRISAAREASAAGVTAAEAQNDVTLDALLLDLVARYHGVTISARALAVQEEAVHSLQQHLHNARALERNGQIPAADRMRVEVALAQAQALQLQQEHALVVAEAALSSLLGLGTDVQPVTPPADTPGAPPLASLQADARDTNPTLRQLDAATQATEQGVRAARADYWPTVTLLGGYELENYQLPELIPEWTVTLNLTLDLFDAGARRAKVSGARAKVREAKSLHRAASDKLQLQVQQLYLAYADAQQRFAVAGRTEALAAESLRMQRAAFREGVARSVDVVDAENALAAARLMRLASHYDSTLAWTGLMLASGHRREVERVFSEVPEEEAGHGK